jgi:hypothetical protein
LDNELEVPENLAILEHVNQCEPCSDLFATEEAAWDRVAALLATPAAPSALKARIPTLLARVDRSHQIQRAGRWLLPISAAAAVVLMAVFYTQEGKVDPVAPPSSGWPTPHAHGVMLSKVLDHWSAVQTSSGTVDMAFLQEYANYHPVKVESLPTVFREIFGENSCRLLRKLCKSGVRVTDGRIPLGSVQVRNCVIATPDLEIGVYVLDRKEADLLDLHLVDDGVSTGLRIERCRSCTVIGISRGDKVVLLVTGRSDQVDPLVDSLVKSL